MRVNFPVNQFAYAVNSSRVFSLSIHDYSGLILCSGFMDITNVYLLLFKFIF